MGSWGAYASQPGTASKCIQCPHFLSHARPLPMAWQGNSPQHGEEGTEPWAPIRLWDLSPASGTVQQWDFTFWGSELGVLGPAPLCPPSLSNHRGGEALS